MKYFSKLAVLIAISYLLFVVIIEWSLVSCTSSGWLNLCGIQRFLIVPELIFIPEDFRLSLVSMDSLFLNLQSRLFYDPDLPNYYDSIYVPVYLGLIAVNSFISYIVGCLMSYLFSKPSSDKVERQT
jgi:hypothetical protein